MDSLPIWEPKPKAPERTFAEELAAAQVYEEENPGQPSMDAGERLAELTRFRDRILARMRRRLHGIHQDFRIYAEEATARLQARMDGVLRSRSA